MILSDSTIYEYARKGMIEPFNCEQLQPASYDLTVGEIQERYGDRTLKPGECCLVATKEIINLPNNVAAFCKTKSSLARIGIISGDIGGWIDPGYKGNITLFVINLSDKEVRINDFKSLGQIIFVKCDDSTSGYDGHYQDSEGLIESYLEPKETAAQIFRKHLV